MQQQSLSFTGSGLEQAYKNRYSYKMCGRYTLHASLEYLRLWFEFLPVTDQPIKPRYNLAPSQQIPVIRQIKQHRELCFMRWGLIPHWAKDEKTGYNLINARAETVAEKPSFRSAFKRYRCLIPANGFYEWQQRTQGKQPYYIHLLNDTVFAFAGLWARWENKEGYVIESCSIIVTTANQLMQPIHDRMPVILNQEDYNTWLDTNNTDTENLKKLLQPYPAELMNAYPVSTTVNSAKNEGEVLIQEIT